MPLAIRTPSALTDLDVPAPSASLYLRRNALLTRRALALAAGGGARRDGRGDAGAAEHRRMTL